MPAPQRTGWTASPSAPTRRWTGDGRSGCSSPRAHDRGPEWDTGTVPPFTNEHDRHHFSKARQGRVGTHGSGREEVDAGVGTDGPVVVLARSVESREGLLVEENDEIVLGGNLGADLMDGWRCRHWRWTEKAGAAREWGHSRCCWEPTRACNQYHTPPPPPTCIAIWFWSAEMLVMLKMGEISCCAGATSLW